MFWTVGLPEDAFHLAADGLRAKLQAEDIPLIESFQFAGVFNTPVTVDISAEWEAPGPFEDLGSGKAVPPDDRAAFLGRFARAQASGRISGSWASASGH